MKVEPGRHLGLDGLRGLAALVVVNYHVFASLEVGASFPFSVQTSLASWLDVLSFSPLRIGFAGGQAVHLFFLVSGFVLSRQVLGFRPKPQNFITARLARLYLPVWPALAISILVSLLTSGVPWAEVLRLHWRDWLLDASLFPGAGKTLGVLWSLTWEVAFSLVVLPAVSFSRPLFRAWFIPVLIAIIVIGDSINIGIVEYLPMFFLGIAINELRSFARGILEWVGASFRSTWEWLIFALALVGTVAAFAAVPILREKFNLEELQTIFLPLELVSIMVIILLAVEGTGVRKALSSPILLWLGKISFSLYLTHQSVIQVLQALAPTSPIRFPVTIAFSVLIAGIYYFCVETRFHQFARRLYLGPVICRPGTG